jgi:hypothetical protein
MSDIETLVAAGVEKRLDAIRGRDRDFPALQRDKLLAIVRNAADTEFGRAHGFADVHDLDGFRAACPPSTADDYLSYWRRTADGERGLLFPEQVHAFGLSSGTTGGPKLIPLNRALVRGFKRAIGYGVAAHMAQTRNYSLLRGYALQMAAPARVRDVGGVPVGYVTGIMGADRTYPFHNIGIPTREIIDIPDLVEKYRRIEERYADYDVRMIFGIPGYTMGLLERLRARGAWPNLEFVATSGVALDTCRGRLQELCPRATLRELYLCTEGAVGFQPDAADPGMQLMVEDVVFEFVRADRWGDPDAPRVDLTGVETGVRYVLLLTTPAGLYAYAPGDVVRFVSVDPPRLVVAGRVGLVLNLSAEKLDEPQAVEVLRRAGLRVYDFSVCPAPDNRGHEWVIEFHDAPPGDAAARVDRALRDVNAIYDHLRVGDLLFEAPRLTAVPRGTFDAAVRRRPGHGKVLRICTDRSVRDELAAR